MMYRQRRWLPHWLDPVALFGALIAGLLVFVVITNAAHDDREAQLRSQQSADLQCIANYENVSSERNHILTQLSNTRAAYDNARSDAQTRVNVALHAITKVSVAGKPISTATAHKLVATLDSALTAYDRADAAFKKADAAYKQAQAQHPLPPPVFTCSDRLNSAADVHSTAPVPSPSIVTYTAVSTAPGATRTYTVTVPQPPVVVTRTNTVVVTQAVQPQNGSKRGPKK